MPARPSSTVRSRVKDFAARVRFHIRKQPPVAYLGYMLPNLYYAILGRVRDNLNQESGPAGRIGLCLRFRDEAVYLAEWLDYYLAAGIYHFFLYNNFSKDNYERVLQPYVAAGRITLIDWPRIPASPSAENDCIARTRGRFEWVGFIDADEFVVIADGRSIPDFLSQFPQACGVALHNYNFGSCGYKERPQEQVISAYTLRETSPNIHFKVFVRPELVTRNRNSHNFYYCRAGRAVNELGKSVTGSMHTTPSAQRAWVNHYLYKSLADYLEKASRNSTLDKLGIRERPRRVERANLAMSLANDVRDTRALEYFRIRKDILASVTPRNEGETASASERTSLSALSN